MWVLLSVFTCFQALQCRSAQPLYGYDCNLPGIHSQAINLNNVGDCVENSTKTETSLEWGQVIQLTPTTTVETAICRIFKSYSVYRCGMHSHQMLVAGPFLYEPVQVSKEICATMISYKTWSPTPKITIKGLQLGTTVKTTVTEEGILNTDGSCEGTTVSVKGNTYVSSFMQSQYEVYINKRMSLINIDTNSIYLPDDLRCTHTDGQCFDAIVGFSFWHPYSGACKDVHPMVLYEGSINTIRESNEFNLVHVESHDFLFVSRVHNPNFVCGRTMLTTDYKNIMILIQDTLNPKLQASRPKPDQINPVLYTNAKISYLQYKTVNNIKAIYQDVIYQLCDVERKMLLNTINLIRISQDTTTPISNFGERGSIITVRGEAAYITTCPVQIVTLRKESKCYRGLPIMYKNATAFLTPITRIIVPNVTEVPCSAINPPLYKIGDSWIAVSPAYLKVHAPDTLHPKTQLKINKISIEDFSKGGIYSTNDIEEFYKSLTHGKTREAALDHIVDSIVNEQPMTYNIISSVNPEGWASMAKGYLKTMWGHFLVFGEVMSGMLGLYFIYFIVSKFVGVIIRGIALHQVYGCSWRLLGAIWSAISFFFITIAKKERATTQQQSCSLEELDEEAIVEHVERPTINIDTSTFNNRR